MSSLSSQAHRAESPCFKHLPKHWLTAILGTAAVLLVLLACWQHRQGYDAVNFQSRKSTHLRNVRAAETPSLIRREQFPDSQSLVPTVPHIIHQIYMQGSSELLKSAMRPGTSFRKEWWSSCKVKPLSLVVGRFTPYVVVCGMQTPFASRLSKQCCSCCLTAYKVLVCNRTKPQCRAHCADQLLFLCHQFCVVLTNHKAHDLAHCSFNKLK